MQTSSSSDVEAACASQSPSSSRTSSYATTTTAKALAAAAATSLLLLLALAATPSASTSSLPARSLIASLAAALPDPHKSPDKNKGCDEQAAYWSNRLIYNNLGLPSLIAGYSANSVEWGFSHKSCRPVDRSCYTFDNTECRFDGCSWFEASEFRCKSLLHGETFVFSSVKDYCEVWAGLDSRIMITCHENGLVGAAAAAHAQSRSVSPGVSR